MSLWLFSYSCAEFKVNILYMELQLECWRDGPVHICSRLSWWNLSQTWSWRQCLSTISRLKYQGIHYSSCTTPYLVIGHWTTCCCALRLLMTLFLSLFYFQFVSWTWFTCLNCLHKLWVTSYCKARLSVKCSMSTRLSCHQGLVFISQSLVHV